MCILFLTLPCIKVWDSWFAEHCGLTVVIPTYTFSTSVNSRVPHGICCPPLITYLTSSPRLKPGDSKVTNASCHLAMVLQKLLLLDDAPPKYSAFTFRLISPCLKAGALRHISVNSTDAPCISSPKERGFAALYINCVLYSGARSSIRTKD